MVPDHLSGQVTYCLADIGQISPCFPEPQFPHLHNGVAGITTGQ